MFLNQLEMRVLMRERISSDSSENSPIIYALSSCSIPIEMWLLSFDFESVWIDIQ